jgi:Flp pilus assembly protein TadD
VLAATPPATAYYDLLQVTWHEALRLPGPERAALLLRAAAGIERGTATGREIAARAGRLAFTAEEFRAAPAEAQETILSALQLMTFSGPGYAAAHQGLGNALLALGQADAAEAAYREAIRLNPRDTMYRMDLGTLLDALGRQADADASYREALQLLPAGAVACLMLGNTLYSTGRFRGARAAYREAIRLNPGDPTFHHSLGLALYASWQFREAEASCREALRLDPSGIEAIKGLGNPLGARAGTTRRRLRTARRCTSAQETLMPSGGLATCCSAWAGSPRRRPSSATPCASIRATRPPAPVWAMP